MSELITPGLVTWIIGEVPIICVVEAEMGTMARSTGEQVLALSSALAGAIDRSFSRLGDQVDGKLDSATEIVAQRAAEATDVAIASSIGTSIDRMDTATRALCAAILVCGLAAQAVAPPNGIAPVTTPTRRKIHQRRISQPPIPARTPPITKSMTAPKNDWKNAVTEKDELVA